MRKTGIAVVAVMVMSGVASAGIVVTVPDKIVDYLDASDSLTLTIQFTGSYDVDSYELDLRLAGRSGASGVTFIGAAEAAGYFLAGNSVGWSTVVDEDLRIYGDDGTATPPETLANTAALNLITVNLDLALDASNIGDVYDVTFDMGGSAIYDTSFAEFGDVTWNDGTITVVPEPASMTLLALGGLLALRRKRK